jgi:N-acyl amino acid synthase of PEP-CTERM/exosortase system
MQNASRFRALPEIYDSHFDLLRADSPELLDRAYQIRYQVYCVENPFLDPIENRNGRETDADDDRSAHLLLIHRQSGEALGTARVIFPDATNVRPLPMERTLDSEGKRVFRQLPRQTTGEVSRFAVCKSFRRRRGEERYADIGFNSTQTRSSLAEQRAMPFITFGLLRGIIGICLENGITHVAAVMEPTLIRLLKRFGIDFQLAGSLIEYHGLRQPCMTCVEDVIEKAHRQDSLFWQYLKEEVSVVALPRHQHDHVNLAGQTAEGR